MPHLVVKETEAALYHLLTAGEFYLHQRLHSKKLEAQISSLATNYEHRLTHVESLKDQINENQEEMKRTSQSINSLRDKLESLNDQIPDLVTTLKYESALASSSQSRIQKRKSKIEKLIASAQTEELSKHASTPLNHSKSNPLAKKVAASQHEMISSLQQASTELRLQNVATANVLERLKTVQGSLTHIIATAASCHGASSDAI